MTQAQVLRKMQRRHWSTLQKLLKDAYREGVEDGLARAHGQGRRGRTIRADATVEGLVRTIERHFRLDRFGFEVRVVYAKSGRKVPLSAQLRSFRVEE